MKYLFFTIAFYWLVACQTPQPSSDSKPVSISNKGVNIVYDDTKTGDTALVFVHGWCINRGYWKDQVDFFKNRYRVVSVDLPGFGDSDKPIAAAYDASFFADAMIPATTSSAQ